MINYDSESNKKARNRSKMKRENRSNGIHPSKFHVYISTRLTYLSASCPSDYRPIAYSDLCCLCKEAFEIPEFLNDLRLPKRFDMPVFCPFSQGGRNAEDLLYMRIERVLHSKSRYRRLCRYNDRLVSQIARTGSGYKHSEGCS